MYEVGRPQRLSVEEAQLLEEQWQDFGELEFVAQRSAGWGLSWG